MNVFVDEKYIEFMYLQLPVVIAYGTLMFCTIYSAMFEAERRCARLFWTFALLIMYACGTAFSIVIFEITHYILIAFMLNKTIDSKIPSLVCTRFIIILYGM